MTSSTGLGGGGGGGGGWAFAAAWRPSPAASYFSPTSSTQGSVCSSEEMLSTMEERHRRLLEADESMFVPPGRRKTHTHTHTNVTPRKGAAGRGRRCARRERPARGRLRSRLARGGTGSRRRPGRSAPSEHPAPSRDGLPRGPVPFCFTFLGSHHEPPGMIRNTWPLGAAGAQEIRTLKLEEERGSRLGKSNVPGAGGCLPWFLRPSTDFLPVAGTPCSRVSGGSLEGERSGRGWGRGRGTGTKRSSWK